MPYLREADAAVLTGFRRLYEGSGLSALNAVGVLSKIDRLTPTGDPVEVARPIAQRVAHELRGVVSDVVPIIGLLAETARAAVFDENDARAIAACAAVDDEFDREDMLMTAQDFLTFAHASLELDESTRRRLLSMLDLYGLKVAIGAVDGGAKGASGVLRALDAASGVAPLAELLQARFAAQADLFKAHAAVCDLRRVSYVRTDPANGRALRALRAPLERIELDTDMHRRRVLEVLQQITHGELPVDTDTQAQLELLVAGADAVARLGAMTRADAVDRALAGAARWGGEAEDVRRGPAAMRSARVVKEAYEVLWHELTTDGAA